MELREFMERVRQAILLDDRSIPRLAKDARVSEVTIYTFVKGRQQTLNPSVLWKVVNVLGMSILIRQKRPERASHLQYETFARDNGGKFTRMPRETVATVRDNIDN